MSLLNQNPQWVPPPGGKTQTPARGSESLWGLTLPICPGSAPPAITLHPPRPQSSRPAARPSPWKPQPFPTSAVTQPGPLLTTCPLSASKFPPTAHSVLWEAFPDTLAHQAHSLAPGGAFILAEKCYLLPSPSTVPITMPQASGPAVPLGEYQSRGNEVLFREPLWGARRMGQGESVPFPLGWAAGRTRARASGTWLLLPALQEPLRIPPPHENLHRSEPRTLHL